MTDARDSLAATIEEMKSQLHKIGEVVQGLGQAVSYYVANGHDPSSFSETYTELRNGRSYLANFRQEIELHENQLRYFDSPIGQ